MLIDASSGTQHAIMVGDATQNLPQDTIIVDLNRAGTVPDAIVLRCSIPAVLP
jgi:hypothetical protein